MVPELIIYILLFGILPFFFLTFYLSWFVLLADAVTAAAELS